MQRSCGSCGEAFDAKRPSAKFCGDTCRKRAQRAGGAETRSAGSTTYAAVLAELDAVERSGTPLGAMALALASRVDDTPGSGAATLVRELRETLSAALEGVAAADAMDELKARRARRRAG